MVKDLELGQHVNLINSSTGERGDYYQRCADLITNAINEWTPNSESDKLVNHAHLNNIKVTRNMVKKPVMTINYNITLEGIKNQMSLLSSGLIRPVTMKFLLSMLLMVKASI